MRAGKHFPLQDGFFQSQTSYEFIENLFLNDENKDFLSILKYLFMFLLEKPLGRRRVRKVAIERGLI